MAFIIRREANTSSGTGDAVTIRTVLGAGSLPDDRLRVEVVELADGASWEVSTTDRSLAWIQVLDGTVDVHGDRRDRSWVVMLARGTSLLVTAQGAATVLVCESMHALDHDVDLAPMARADVDWSREPVLSSEHDARQRIYLASPALWGTDAVKGEMIIYPSGSSGAPHHHEGAEHFQFMISGSLTADLAGDAAELSAGDLLYNLEHEVHAFRNETAEEAVFVEFFIPGANRTVWVPGVEVCTWNPTGRDIEGRPPVRDIPSHVHGAIDV